MPRSVTRAMLLIRRTAAARSVAEWERPHRADRLRGTRLGVHVPEEGFELRTVERLTLEQRLCHPVERGSMLLEQTPCLFVCIVRQPGLLRVAHPFRLLRERIVVGPHRPS